MTFTIYNTIMMSKDGLFCKLVKRLGCSYYSMINVFLNQIIGTFNVVDDPGNVITYAI